MGYTDLAHLTHLLENVLDAIRNGDMEVTSDWLDILFEGSGSPGSNGSVYY